MSYSMEITDQFIKWNDALCTGDLEKVIACYAEDAILLPTLSTRVCRNHDEIRDYFVEFLANKPIGRMDQENIRRLDSIAVNSGLYTFSIVKNGRRSDLPARFTFVYRKDAQGWRIIEHHSSLLPVQP